MLPSSPMPVGVSNEELVTITIDPDENVTDDEWGGYDHTENVSSPLVV